MKNEVLTISEIGRLRIRRRLDQAKLVLCKVLVVRAQSSLQPLLGIGKPLILQTQNEFFLLQADNGKSRAGCEPV
jgi:hypothetical protein